MYKDSIETKILRSILPILIYFFINILVQLGFAIAVTMTEFVALGEGSIMNYFVTYNFSGDVARVAMENGLFVTLISGIITVPIALKMMKNDADAVSPKTMKAHFSNVKLNKWYYIVLLGLFASMGISKAVTILPIDNILGSYEEVGNSFAANPLVLQILALVIMGPLTEEIIFRGLVYKRVKRYTDSVKGAIISAVVFGIYHYNLVQGIYGFILGILLVFVYEKYKTIAAPVIMHLSANLIALLMMYSDISTAINKNIYLKILVMLVEIAVMAVVLWKMNTIDDMGNKEIEKEI